MEDGLARLQAMVEEEMRRTYSETAIDHAMNPRNMGRLKDADGWARYTGPCGDTMEMYLRLEPDGNATHVPIDAEYELPGKMPGLIKDIMTKGWFERQTRQMLADLKVLTEAKVPAQA